MHAATDDTNHKTVAEMVVLAPTPMVQVSGKVRSSKGNASSNVATFKLLLQALLLSSKSDTPVKRQHAMLNMPAIWKIFLEGFMTPRCRLWSKTLC